MTQPSDMPGVEMAAADGTAADAPSADAPTADVPTADAATSEPAPGLPSSSDPRVADALSLLAEVDRLPLEEQVEVFADIHRRLAGVLADPDSQA